MSVHCFRTPHSSGSTPTSATTQTPPRQIPGSWRGSLSLLESRTRLALAGEKLKEGACAGEAVSLAWTLCWSRKVSPPGVLVAGAFAADPRATVTPVGGGSRSGTLPGGAASSAGTGFGVCSYGWRAAKGALPADGSPGCK
eukprot:scaffold624_cov402-Prasinococcus_capsulatus_cf.AAC.12